MSFHSHSILLTRIYLGVLFLLFCSRTQADSGGNYDIRSVDYVGEQAESRQLINEDGLKELDSAELRGEQLSVAYSENHTGYRGFVRSSLDFPCTATRYGGPAQYLDNSTKAVFQHYSAANGLSYPFAPLQLDLGLYFSSPGNATDSVRLLISISCLGFGELCCTPRLQDCIGMVDVQRGSEFPTLLEVAIDLGELECCFTGEFWVAVAVDEVFIGDAPSFVFSSASNDPSPPQPCEQWLIRDGRYVSETEDDLGWAYLSIGGECEGCDSLDAVECPDGSASIDLDCDQILQITCGADPITLTNQTNAGEPSDVSFYCCAAWNESGPERIYSINVPDNGNLTVELLNVTGGDIDLFVLDTCSAGGCLLAADSMVSMLDLPGGLYYIVVDGYQGDIADFDIRFTCFGECPAVVCPDEISFGHSPGNLYLDGEWDRTLDAMYYSYYAGSGTSQTILSGSPLDCQPQPTVIWQSVDSAPNRMLAVDPRNGGQFWCGTITNYETGSGHLYLVNSSGAVVRSWSAISNLPIMRWSGAAYDPDHDHLWVFIRDSIDAGYSRAYELDVSNDASPLVIQGPHIIPQLSPHTSLSTGGADYSNETDILTVVHQGFPVDFIECYLDIDPVYPGPPPGPGIAETAWCSPDNNNIQGFGVAAFDDGEGDGSLLLMNFTDEDFFHPLNRYPSPARLHVPDCPPVTNLITRKSGSNIQLQWTPSQPGIFRIYSSIIPSNDGDPDNGTDPDFTLLATVLGTGPTSWNDLDGIVSYRNYVVLRFCP